MKTKNQFPFKKIFWLIVYLLIGITPIIEASSHQLEKGKSHFTTLNTSSLKLVGDAEICMVLGKTIGIYSAGGNPEDVYEWKIVKSTGEEIYNRSGGQQFESIKFAFSEIGEYTVSLKVRRGTESNFYKDQMLVRVQNGPKLALLPDYLLCGENPVMLTALDPNTPNIENYTITWKDVNRNTIGTGNDFLASKEGFYLVDLYLKNPGGSQTCAINGSTYVGPATDFQITKSSSQLCEGGSIQISTDTPLSGEWNVRKMPNGEQTSLGNGYGINLSSGELDGPGFYEVSFRVPSLDFPDCPSVRKTTFEVVQAPQFEVQILEQPDACFVNNGSFQVKAISDLESLSIPELDFFKKNISKGQIFTFDNLKAKIYLVEIDGNGCTTNKLVQLKAQDTSNTSPSENPNLTVSQVNESCVSNKIVPGKVSLDLGESIANGKYRILSSSRGLVKSGAIPENGKFEVELNSGNYLIEMTVDNCTYPLKSITILDQPQVNFSIPAKITICDSFLLVPETEEQLLFTLTSPSGKVESSKTGEGFTLTEQGKYSLLAAPVNSGSTFCAKRIDFTATVLSSFTFTPVLVEEGCFDPIRYRAKLEGINPGKVNIRWLNSDGVIVGRSQEFYPPSIGKFSLLMSPVGSGFCPVAPVEFEVVAPIINVPMDLGLSNSCSDPEAVVISLSTNLDEVVTTEWIFYDESNNREEKEAFDNLYSIQAKKSGTYEAVAYNKLGCEIGRNFIFVETITPYPVLDLEDNFPVCSNSSKNAISAIDPGEYASYAWYFGEQLVSTKRLYKPDQIGTYQLFVTTEEGCEFADSFTTSDVCNYDVVYPNAMVLGNPNKDFRVVMSDGITEAELFVLNRQGQLIYHASNKDIPVETPVLTWDGKSNGRYVPTGNYVVVIILRNSAYSLEEKKTGTLLILS